MIVKTCGTSTARFNQLQLRVWESRLESRYKANFLLTGRTLTTMSRHLCSFLSTSYKLQFPGIFYFSCFSFALQNTLDIQNQANCNKNENLTELN